MASTHSVDGRSRAHWLLIMIWYRCDARCVATVRVYASPRMVRTAAAFTIGWQHPRPHGASGDARKRARVHGMPHEQADSACHLMFAGHSVVLLNLGPAHVPGKSRSILSSRRLISLKDKQAHLPPAEDASIPTASLATRLI